MGSSSSEEHVNIFLGMIEEGFINKKNLYITFSFDFDLFSNEIVRNILESIVLKKELYIDSEFVY